MPFGTRLIATSPLLLLLAGCAHIATQIDVPDCARLIPPSLKQRVPPTELTEGKPAWDEAFILQTVQLDKANDRGDGIDFIYSECLKLHRDEMKRSTRRKVLGLL